jgi:hypothetical protein
VLGDVRKGVRKSLDGDIRDIRSNLDIWINDAHSHVTAKWGDVDDTEAELERRRRHRDDVTEICDRMVSRLQPVEVPSG